MKHPRKLRVAAAHPAKTNAAKVPCVATKLAAVVDSTQVSFLYGDLAVDQRTVAELLHVSISAVERHVRKDKIVRGRPRAYSAAIASDLARVLGATLPDLSKLKTEDEWPALRTFLRSEVIRELKRTSITWIRLRSFLADLPYRLAAADARLTKSRLGFVCGDLAMSTREIATLFAAPPSIVLARVTGFGIHRGSTRNDKLSSDVLASVAHRFGLSEWPLNYENLSRFDRFWPTWQKGVREGLLRLAAQGRLDLSVLDDFIAEIPQLAEERRRAIARMTAKVKPAKKPAPRAAA